MHGRESQNTNQRTCQGSRGKVWHLPLFWYCRKPSLLSKGLIARLHPPPQLDNFFNLRLAVLELLLQPPPPPPPPVSFSIDLSSQGCASKINRSHTNYMQAIYIRSSRLRLHHHFDYACVFARPPLSLWSILLFFLKLKKLKNKTLNYHNQMKLNQYGSLPLWGKCAERKVMGCKQKL